MLLSSSPDNSADGQGKEIIRNLSLHLKSGEGSFLSPWRMIDITIWSPGRTVEAFGLTQYSFGAVVLTLKAKGVSELFLRVIVSVEDFVNGAIE